MQPHVSNETVGSGIELVQPEEAIAVRIVFVALWVNAFTSYPDGIVRFSNFLRMRGWDAETFGQAQRLTLAAAINDEELVSDAMPPINARILGSTSCLRCASEQLAELAKVVAAACRTNW